jgi:NADP-dependent 3-hydroxy acid dehydrogenase YdfG
VGAKVITILLYANCWGKKFTSLFIHLISSFIPQLSRLLLLFIKPKLMSQSQSFRDKVVIITGGTSGIGKALVRRFLTEGTFVATCGRNGEKLQALQAELDSDRVFTQVADMSKEMDCKNFVENTIRKFGRIDVLINNAGISMRALFDELEDLHVLRELMDVNFWGCVYCTWYALAELKKNQGTVVGVSSIAGYRGLPGRVGYSASKFAMQGFMEVLRTENLHTGLHVMWVSPGFTNSNIRNTALDKCGQAQAETPLEENKLMSASEVADRILQAIRRRKRTSIMTFQGKLTVWMNKWFPALTDKLVYNHFKKEPGSPLK